MRRTPLTRSVPSRGEDKKHLEDLWDEPAPSKRPAQSIPDAEALQGAWLSIAGRRPARLLVSGDHLTVHFQDGDIYMGIFTLGVNGRLRLMDVSITQGPSRHRGLTALAVFDWEGETLHWCTASPGQEDRPAALAEHDSRHLLLVFRRERPTG
jgi:uncharacterized protein (TIGR03067 family)